VDTVRVQGVTSTTLAEILNFLASDCSVNTELSRDGHGATRLARVKSPERENSGSGSGEGSRAGKQRQWLG
jgi:hypothetical protein